MRLKVIPLAAESLGTRSMCTYVESPDLRVLIDPGVSLGPRFRLLPHPKEYEALREARRRLAEHADLVSVVTVSHYHFDHATPTYTDYVWNFCDLEVARQLYRGKVVLGKDHRSTVNFSQRRRGWMLMSRIGDVVKSFEPADGRTFTYGGTTLRFSSPVFHGERGTPLGWVLMLSVDCGGDIFLHASDIQGPMVSETADMLVSSKPSLAYLGGPPTYLAGYRGEGKTVAEAFMNMSRIVERVPTVVDDHHLMREGELPKGFEQVQSTAKEAGHRVLTAAELLGQENVFLEARRRELYEEFPPSEEFVRWTKLPEDKRARTPPPL